MSHNSASRLGRNEIGLFKYLERAVAQRDEETAHIIAAEYISAGWYQKLWFRLVGCAIGLNDARRRPWVLQTIYLLYFNFEKSSEQQIEQTAHLALEMGLQLTEDEINVLYPLFNTTSRQLIHSSISMLMENEWIASTMPPLRSNVSGGIPIISQLPGSRHCGSRNTRYPDLLELLNCLIWVHSKNCTDAVTPDGFCMQVAEFLECSVGLTEQSDCQKFSNIFKRLQQTTGIDSIMENAALHWVTCLNGGPENAPAVIAQFIKTIIFLLRIMPRQSDFAQEDVNLTLNAIYALCQVVVVYCNIFGVRPSVEPCRPFEALNFLESNDNVGAKWRGYFPHIYSFADCERSISIPDTEVAGHSIARRLICTLASLSSDRDNDQETLSIVTYLETSYNSLSDPYHALYGALSLYTQPKDQALPSQRLDCSTIEKRPAFGGALKLYQEILSRCSEIGHKWSTSDTVTSAEITKDSSHLMHVFENYRGTLNTEETDHWDHSLWPCFSILLDETSRESRTVSLHIPSNFNVLGIREERPFWTQLKHILTRLVL